MTPEKIRELLDAAVALRREINAALEGAEPNQWVMLQAARGGLNVTVRMLTDMAPELPRGDRGREDN